MLAKLFRVILVSVLLWLLASCGTTTGNYGVALVVQGTKPGSLVSAVSRFLGFAAVRAPTSITAVDKNGSAGGTVTLTDARLALKEIKFKRSGEGTGDVKYAGPFVVDLLTDTVTPSFETIALSAGTYTEFEMKLAKIETGLEASDSLLGKSIYLEGTYSGPTGNSGTVTGIPFTLALEIDEEFELPAGAKGFDVADNTLSTVIIAFRMAKWFAFDSPVNDKSEDLSDVLVSSGRIDLSDASPTTNKNIWEVVRNLVKASADFGKDEDGSGKLESDEDEDDDGEDGDDN